MKERIRELIQAVPNRIQATNVVREYLQARILSSLQRSGAMIPLAFHGGTALRFLYAIERYSEDLDFALEGARSQYDFAAYLSHIQGDLEAENYDVDVKVSDKRVVHSAFVRLRGLLYELGLSPHVGQTLAIKVEVDTNPPAGAVLETTVVRRHLTLHLQHHDKASLLAGKLHAVLDRPYLKGRDLYDLMWYLSDPAWPGPNLFLLNSALHQTGWSGPELTKVNWRRLVRERIESTSWANALSDVRPFLGPAAGPELLTRENLSRLLS